MGKQCRGVYPDGEDRWQVDKWFAKSRIRRRGFVAFSEAEAWLIEELARRRQNALFGTRRPRSFGEAVRHYQQTQASKQSIETELCLLQGVMPFVGHLGLHQVHDGTLAPFVAHRLSSGRAHKTVNLALGVVRRILNLAAHVWRGDDGHTWLSRAPHITMLPLVGHQRDPRPIGWEEQHRLLPLLPPHLARMALFVLNTGVRDRVVCGLRWDWEIEIPELGISVFDVPRENVKGGRRGRLVVCNSVAQQLINEVRGQHDEFVFVYRRERLKNVDLEPEMPYRPIETMNNTAWQRARREAGLGDLHVHDLRHTTGMRLREAGVQENTIADVLWHSTRTTTHHYSLAQIVELKASLEKIGTDAGCWNKSLATLRMEHQARLAKRGRMS